MDIIVISTVAAQGASMLIEKLQDRQARAPVPPPPIAGASTASAQAASTAAASQRNSASDSTSMSGERSGSASGSEDSGRDDSAVVPEDDVARLEAKLSELQERAKRLTSPDAFVQYAQVTREANRVEKELTELKAARRAAAPDGADGDMVDALAEWLTTAANGLGGQAARGAGRSAAWTTGIHICHTLFLWLFFRSGGWGLFGRAAGSSVVTQLPCDALRPLTRLLASRARFDSCGADDWTCAADAARTCTIGVTVAVLFAKVAIGALRRAFVRRRDDDGGLGGGLGGGSGWS